MCWTCDHPGTTQADFYDHMAGLIQRCGWAVQAVERDRYRPPFAYTVGLTLYGEPELVVTGMAQRRAQRLLNGVAEHVLHACAPEPGEVVPLEGSSTIEIVELPHPDAHLHTAVGMLGAEHLRALQLVWADDRGRWPWERGHRSGRGGQPVLGPRTPARRDQE